MTQDALRIIIVGGGAIGRVAHIPAALASPEVELVGIVDPDTKQAERSCKLYGIRPEIASDASRLHATFDAALIATPNNLHAATAKPFIERRIPVLIEKPLAADQAEADEIADMARANQSIVAVGYQMRHSVACQTLKLFIDTEHFGKAIRFACQHGSRGGWSPVSGYNLDKSRAGGGVLVTTGTHFLDRLIWFWGTPTDFSYRDNGEKGPESHCIAHFTFGNGADAVSGCAIFSKLVGLPESFVVETQQGWLILSNAAPEKLMFRPRANPAYHYEVHAQSSVEDPRTLYQRQLEDFVHACRSGHSPAVDAAAGSESVKLLGALYACRQPLVADPDVS